MYVNDDEYKSVEKPRFRRFVLFQYSIAPQRVLFRADFDEAGRSRIDMLQERIWRKMPKNRPSRRVRFIHDWLSKRKKIIIGVI